MAIDLTSIPAYMLSAFRGTHPHLVWWLTHLEHREPHMLSMRCGRCRCTVNRDIRDQHADSVVLPILKSMLDQHDLECDELNELAVDSRARLKLGEAPRTNYEYAEAMATAYMAVADELSKGKLVKA